MHTVQNKKGYFPIKLVANQKVLENINREPKQELKAKRYFSINRLFAQGEKKMA